MLQRQYVIPAACIGIVLLLAGCGGSPGSDHAAAATSGSSTTTTTPPPVTGSATLSWMPPTENTDGTALTDLAGYYIHYGTSADALNQVIDVPGGATTTYEIDYLAQGTYYFSVSAYTSAGTESAPSSVASKSI